MAGARFAAHARALIAFALLFSGGALGCSSAGAPGRWFGGGGDDGPAAGVRPSAWYTGSAKTPVYQSPDASSAIVAELTRYEGVLRYQVEGDFAYVTAQTSGARGWVRTSALVDRPPAAKSAPRSAAPRAAAPTAPVAPESKTEPAAEPTEVEPAPAPTEPGTPTAPPEKSIFDPY